MCVKTLEEFEIGHIYTITVTEIRDEDGNRKWKKKRKYRLLQKYKNHMLFENNYGIKETFTNNELYQKIMEGEIVA